MAVLEKIMTKLTFIADTHYFAPSLAKPGRAYEMRSGSDQKCLLETGAIIDAAFETIKKAGTDAVLIAGDVSNDGEKISHIEFREKLRDMKKTVPVYLITATHDWCCDQNPRMYDGNAIYHDVETLDHTELRDFYYEFGPEQSDAEFITHLGVCSYTVDIGENVRILALNDDQNGKGRAGFTEDHFKWIEEQIKKAHEDGKIMIGMEHHLLIAHVHPFITGGGTCVGDREEVASRLADAGLRYMFVGHSHMQAVDKFVSEAGNTLTEVNIGSLVGYPSPMIQVEVDENGLHVSTMYLETFEYEGKKIDAQDYLKKHALAMLDRILECTNCSKYEFADRLQALQIEGKALETAKKMYPIFKCLIRMINSADTMGCYKLLAGFGLVSKDMKNSFKAYASKKLTDWIHEMFLSFMDGQINRTEKGSDYYNVVMSVCRIPLKLKPSRVTENLAECIENILLGNEYNIEDCNI